MIPLIDLKAQHSAIREELLEALARAIDDVQFILGNEVAAFEEEFAAVCGGGCECIGVNSGTSALHLALLACGVGEGDEVITTPFTFLATAAAIRYAGARPVFADVDPATLTIDPARVERAITAKTKAIIPVHLYGQVADMDPLLEIAQRRGLKVIEDAAQAHAAEYQGRRAGSIGDVGCFSFYPSKNLGACGEAGMVVTADANLAEKVRMLRDWGQREKSRHEMHGFNYRMEGFQGAVLRVKLRRLEAWTDSRRRHAAHYHGLLKDVEGLKLPAERPSSRHVYHVYVARTGRRDELRDFLREAGVQTGVHYPTPLHLLPIWSDLGYQRGDFPHAEAAAAEALSIPMYPELEPAQIEEVAGAVKEFLCRKT